MIARVVVAITGAVIVTAVLLLGMDALTSVFRNHSAEKYFRITDVLPKPPPGRPKRPEDRAPPPSPTVPEAVNPDASVTIEAPEAPTTQSPRLAAPEIEPPPSPEAPAR